MTTRLLVPCKETRPRCTVAQCAVCFCACVFLSPRVVPFWLRTCHHASLVRIIRCLPHSSNKALIPEPGLRVAVAACSEQKYTVSTALGTESNAAITSTLTSPASAHGLQFNVPPLFL
ncbi:hypothetical protein BDZ89DRAFT_1060400 [Hymenopellis radicata]|nr:hypothetical protein BDZ89DRAFT_1060400 [Hymenopellis radicata]